MAFSPRGYFCDYVMLHDTGHKGDDQGGHNLTPRALLQSFLQLMVGEDISSIQRGRGIGTTAAPCAEMEGAV